MGSNNVNISSVDERVIAQKEAERKAHDDQQLLAQQRDAAEQILEKILFIIKYLPLLLIAAQFLQKIAEDIIRKLHESEKAAFAADMQQYQADIKKMELAAQLANELAEQKKKFAELKEKLEQLKSFFENLISLLTNYINIVSNRYAANVNSFINSTAAFVNALPIQQFHGHNGVFDLKDHLQSHLEVVYEKLRQRQIAPKDFKDQVLAVARECAATFIKKMDISDHKTRQSTRATVSTLIDESVDKLERMLDSQAPLINSLQTDHVAIAKAEKLKASLTDKAKTLVEKTSNFTDVSETLKAPIGEQANPEHVERTCSSVVNLTSSVSELSKDSTSELDDLADFLQLSLTSSKLSPEVNSSTLDADADSTIQHGHSPSAPG